MCPVRTKNINSLLWRGYDIPEPVKAEINLLFNMSVNELRAKYREVFGYNMNSRNKDFLLRKIAWKLQANLFGDIPEELKNTGDRIRRFFQIESPEYGENRLRRF